MRGLFIYDKTNEYSELCTGDGKVVHRNIDNRERISWESKQKKSKKITTRLY